MVRDRSEQVNRARPRLPPLVTAQETLPYEVVSSVSGNASAIRATSSNVTMEAL